MLVFHGAGRQHYRKTRLAESRVLGLEKARTLAFYGTVIWIGKAIVWSIQASPQRQVVVEWKEEQ